MAWMCLVTSGCILAAQIWANVAKLTAHSDPKQVAKPTFQGKANRFFLNGLDRLSVDERDFCFFGFF